MSATVSLKAWVKRGENPAARLAFRAAKAVRGARMPVIRPLHRMLYALHKGVTGAWANATRILWWTPMFLSRVENDAPGLYLEGGMPLVLGPLSIRLGRDVRLSATTTLTGRTAILAASETLAARFPAHKTRLLPHGVDAALFSTPAPRLDDLPAGGPVAGFYGSLAPWIDLDLVAATARLLPEWRFVMIGAAQTDLSAIEGIGNIERLGARPHAALPGYAQHWDAGIIPFRDTPQIRACNPLKLREYLAAGRPVVSTDFPALDGYRDLVQVATTPEDFAAALRASLTDTNAPARQAAVAAQSWAARAAEAAAWIDAL